jgi:hypothetical protein
MGSSMTGSNDWASAHAAMADRVGGCWLYPLLLIIETIGTVILCWKGLPLYRLLVADPASYATREQIWIWALTAIVLIQIGYWLRYQIRPALPRLHNALLGHIVLFVSRLSFVVATSIFSFVFIAKKLEGQVDAARYLLMVVALFSLFCYMLELQRFGSALIGPEQKSTERAR